MILPEGTTVNHRLVKDGCCRDGLSITARIHERFLILYISLKRSGRGCPLLRATFSPAHPLARRDVPSSRARPFKGRAFREQKGLLAAPFPIFPHPAMMLTP